MVTKQAKHKKQQNKNNRELNWDQIDSTYSIKGKKACQFNSKKQRQVQIVNVFKATVTVNITESKTHFPKNILKFSHYKITRQF